MCIPFLSSFWEGGNDVLYTLDDLLKNYLGGLGDKSSKLASSFNCTTFGFIADNGNEEGRACSTSSKSKVQVPMLLGQCLNMHSGITQ